MSGADLTLQEKEELVELLEESRARKNQNKLNDFYPYDYQKLFFNASSDHITRFLMSGNRTGKSEGAAYEITIHATGLYPDWWTGRRFDTPTRQLCSGVSNTSVRDIMQSKLLGDSAEPELFGTGMIPKRLIGKTTRKAGIPDAISSVLVRHVSGGWSKISFISYEAGKEAFMGTSMHHVNLDEEPPMDIYSQAIRSIVDTDGIITITATPENGMTELVYKFTEDTTGKRYLQQVTWDDCPHLTPEVQAKMLDEIPEHEREMRSKGIPVLGSGMVYPIAEEALVVAAFDIPDHWPRIAGIDFGWDHPTAWVSVAWDRDSDTVYVYDVYSKSNDIPAIHAMNIKHRGGSGIPTAWPHDGLITDKTSGVTLRQLYRDEGVNMLPEKFSNPPTPDGKSGGNGVEAGIHAIYQRMRLGTFKVFDHLEEWLREWRGYHRMDGKIVKKKDDLMDATRYAVMSVRYAQLIGHRYEVYNPYEHESTYQDDLVAY